MSRYIDDDEALKIIKKMLYETALNNFTTDRKFADACEEIAEHRLATWIDAVPTADVVEVVRCKDCVNWQDDWYTSHDGYHYCAMIDIIIDGDFYCKDGERKILPKD